MTRGAAFRTVFLPPCVLLCTLALLLVVIQPPGGSGRGSAWACSDISGTGGPALGGCNDRIPTPPSGGGYRSPPSSYYRPAPGGFSPGAVGAAAGAAAAILGTLGSRGGSRGTVEEAPQQPSEDKETCERLTKKFYVDAAEQLLHGLANLSDAEHQCENARLDLDRERDRLSSIVTYLSTCPSYSLTDGDGTKVDSSNVSAWRRFKLRKSRSDTYEACHKTHDKWVACEANVEAKAYDDARTCFKDMLPYARGESNSDAVARADKVIDWVDKYEARLAQAAREEEARRLHEAKLATAKARYGDPFSESGDPFAAGTNDAVVASARRANANPYAASDNPFDTASGDHLYQTIPEDNVYGTGVYRDGTSAPGSRRAATPTGHAANPYAAGDNPFDTAAGDHLYKTVPEDNVYATGVYRDGTTSASVQDQAKTAAALPPTASTSPSKDSAAARKTEAWQAGFDYFKAQAGKATTPAERAMWQEKIAAFEKLKP